MNNENIINDENLKIMIEEKKKLQQKIRRRINFLTIKKPKKINLYCKDCKLEKEKTPCHTNYCRDCYNKRCRLNKWKKKYNYDDPEEYERMEQEFQNKKKEQEKKRQEKLIKKLDKENKEYERIYVKKKTKELNKIIRKEERKNKKMIHDDIKTIHDETSLILDIV